MTYFLSNENFCSRKMYFFKVYSFLVLHQTSKQNLECYVIEITCHAQFTSQSIKRLELKLFCKITAVCGQ